MKKSILITTIILSGCATAPVYEMPPLTDQQIKDANNSALCSLSSTTGDPRTYAEIQSRNIDCDHASLVCSSKGLNKGSKGYDHCKSGVQTEYAVQEKKRSNPAYAYCLDSDFKAGTQAMATCMASYNEQRQNQVNLVRQQEFMEQEMAYERAWQRSRDSQKLFNQLPRPVVSVPSIPSPSITSETPKTTDCRPDQLSGGFSCTTR